MILKTCPFAGKLARRFGALGGTLAAIVALASPAAAQTNGTFRSLGGTGQAGYQDGVQGFSAFSTPHGVAARGDGFIYIADSGNNAVRTLRLSDHLVDTYTTVNLNRPVGLVFDSLTNLFVANQGNSSIVKFDAFGNYRQIFRPSLTGGAITALAIDNNDYLYIAQQNGVVTRLSPSGFITDTFQAPADGRVHTFRGVAVAEDGSVYVSDAAQHVIWRYTGPGGSPELFAGIRGVPGKNQGERTFGQLNNPHNLAIAPNGSIVVADRGNHQLRAVSCEGVISVLAGIDPSRWFTFESPEVFPGWWDSTAEFAELRDPVGVTVDAAGNVFDTEVYYHLVRAGLNLNFPACGDEPLPNDPLTPVLSPNSGFFTNGVTVIVSSANGVPFGAGTTVRYTLDGSDPTQNSLAARIVDGEGQITLRGPIDVALLKVRVFNNGVPGPIVSGQPTVFEPVTVQLSPNQGFFPEGVQVRVTSASAGGFGPFVQIYYTTDLSDPDQNDTRVPIDNNGVATISLPGPVDLQHLRVRAFNNNVPGPIASGVAPVLPLPGLNPSSGYFITNVVITITNANNPGGLFPTGTRLFYTIDRTQPFQGSPEVPIVNGIGRLELTGPVNLENLSVRAFLGNTAGATVTGQPTSDLPNRISFGFEPPQEASSDFVAAPGQTFYAPVTLTIRPGQLMYGLQFGLNITNVTGPATAAYNQDFRSLLKRPHPEVAGAFIGIPPATLSSKFVFYTTNIIEGEVVRFTNVVLNFESLVMENEANRFLTVGWLERFTETNLYNTLQHDLIRFSSAHDILYNSSQGKVIAGAYSFVLPPNATDGQTYRIAITRPSANSDGIREDVFIETPNSPAIPIRAVQTVTIGERRYTVGDLAPFRWFNAGDFGDGNILNNDMEQIHQTVIYGINSPPEGSDMEGAIDSCCVDLNGTSLANSFDPTDGNDTTINRIAFGDGDLNIADLFVSFRRSLDPSLVWYERYWSNGVLRANAIPNTFRGQTTQLSASAFRNELPADADGGGLSAFSISEEPGVTFRVGGVKGAPGQVVEVPVYASVRGDRPIRTLLLNLKVSTLDGRAGIQQNVQFYPHPLLGGPTFGGGGNAGGYAAAWLNPNHPGLLGEVLIGTLLVTIPANASSSSAYLVQIEKASASPNGVGVLPSTTEDGIIIMSNRPGTGWNDGIPDAWRVQYFGQVADLSSAGERDADGDGVTNLREFQLGSNPKNSDDHMRVRAAISADRSMKLRFPTVAGRKYQLEVSDTLTPGSWTTVHSDILGTGSEVEVSSSSALRYGYYRVRVQE
jgi:hypothetical protein